MGSQHLDDGGHFSPLGIYLLACMCGGMIFPRDVLGWGHPAWMILGVVGGIGFCMATSMAWIWLRVIVPTYVDLRVRRRRGRVPPE